MITGRDVLYARELRKQAVADARQAHLVRQVQGRRASLKELYSLGLTKLGTWLVARGQHLQARFASAQLEQTYKV
jgi:hypothetical protein